MTPSWKAVRVFISSTFRDMHAERDHLVRVVFPELRERCAKRRLHLIDVDLRWGVTEEEAEHGKALEICLDEIERCRPFLVGLLGERYGWVPSRYAVPDEPQYDWVRGFASGHSITALEIYHGVLRTPAKRNRAFFYFRNPGFILDLPEPLRADFLPENDEAKGRLERLKYEIRQHCVVRENYVCRYGGVDSGGRVQLTGLEAFGQQVLEDLWSSIDAENPVDDQASDPLAVERTYHEAFCAGRTRQFIGRQDLLSRLTEYADGRGDTPLVVTGAPGCGKSALLAQFATQHATNHPDAFVLPHFIGVSPGSTDIRRTLLRVGRELVHHFGLANDIPEDYQRLRQKLPAILEQAGSRARVVLVLDGLNQLDEDNLAHQLHWLPQTLPQGLRVIVSTLKGDCLDALRCRRPAPGILLVGPLVAREQEDIIKQTLGGYRKQLQSDQLDLLLKKRESASPLYLMVACEELRLFGEYERVTDRIERLPGDVEGALEQMLQRVEHDHGIELVESALSFLECSQNGLLEGELLELLRRKNEEQLPPAVWARVYRSLQFYLRPPGETGEGVLDFFHRQLAKAVRRRYLKGDDAEAAVHARLASYFRRKADPNADSSWSGNSPRGLSELPHQLTHGRLWSELETTLCDLAFIEAKCAAKMTYELVSDYERLGLGRAGPGPPIVTAWLHRGRLGVRCPVCLARTVVHEAKLGQSIECPVCRSGLKLNPFFVSAEWQWSDGEITASQGKSVSGINPSKGLSEFADFVRRQAHILSGQPSQVFQKAANEPDAFAPAIAARSQWEAETNKRPWIQWVNKPQHQDPCLMTFPGVNGCAFSPDGRYIVSPSADNALRMWDAQTGECVRTMRGHTADVTACAYSPEGRLIASASRDGTLRLWNIVTGQEIATLETGSSSDCAFSPNGRRVAVCTGSSVKIWDIPYRRLYKTLQGSCEAWKCMYSADGRLIASAHVQGAPHLSRRDMSYCELRVWDAETGNEIQIVQDGDFSRQRTAVAFSPDAQKVVFGLRWQLDAFGIPGQGPEPLDQEKNELQSTPGRDGQFPDSPDLQTARVNIQGEFSTGAAEGCFLCCSFSPDGRQLAAGTESGRLVIWDCQSGECLTVNEAHSDPVTACVYSPDARRLATASTDGTVKVWDTERGYGARVHHRLHAQGIDICTFSPDGQRILSVSSNKFGGFLLLSDAETLVEISDISRRRWKDPYPILSVAYSPDGRRIVAGADDGRLHMWDANPSDQEEPEVHDANGSIWPLSSGEVRSLAYSPDGSRLVCASRGGIRIIDPTTGVTTATLTEPNSQIEARLGSVCSFSPDGGQIVSNGREGALLWNAETGRILMTVPGTSPRTFSPDGRLVVTSQESGLRAWDVRSGLEAARFADSLETRGCAYTADGLLLISPANNQSLRVWRGSDGAEILRYAVAVPLWSLGLSRAGQYVAVGAGGEASGQIFLLRLIGFKFGPAIVTPVYLYRSDNGQFDAQPTVKCDWCGRRSVPTYEVIDAILGIAKNSNLTAFESPCSCLPDEAWDELRLVSECPLCSGRLKFNPFLVDNRHRFRGSAQ